MKIDAKEENGVSVESLWRTDRIRSGNRSVIASAGICAMPPLVVSGPHATGWRCTVEGARIGNLALRAQDHMIRGGLALQRLYTLIGDGNGGSTCTWERPDWLGAFPEMTLENLPRPTRRINRRRRQKRNIVAERSDRPARNRASMGFQRRTP